HLERARSAHCAATPGPAAWFLRDPEPHRRAAGGERRPMPSSGLVGRFRLIGSTRRGPSSIPSELVSQSELRGCLEVSATLCGAADVRGVLRNILLDTADRAVDLLERDPGVLHKALQLRSRSSRSIGGAGNAAADFRPAA